MQVLMIMFTVFFMVCLLFGKITVDGKKVNSFFYKTYASIFFSIFLTLLFGLPLLGIIKLLGL